MGKLKFPGVQSSIMSMPVTNSTRTLATNPSSDMRSSAPAALLTTGRWNSFGITDHSLASTSGKAIIPRVT